jgi:uncharacterized small protein (DUF1192 family)
MRRRPLATRKKSTALAAVEPPQQEKVFDSGRIAALDTKIGRLKAEMRTSVDERNRLREQRIAELDAEYLRLLAGRS